MSADRSNLPKDPIAAETEPALCGHPAVCAVGRDYCLIFLCRRHALASVIVDGETYTDSNNGVMRTATRVHKITVPGDALNRARRYTVHVAPLADHCSYFAKPEPTEAYTYEFTPVPADGPVELYVLADTHGDDHCPAEAVLRRPHVDLLVLDGDIGDSSSSAEQIETLHRLVSTITRGQYPVVYARGNHDTRGPMAEFLTDYIPTREGRTYYTFRQGPIWGIVLDAGEDKCDDRIEYGGVCDFAGFRREETAFIRSVIAHAADEYEAPGVRYRLGICHINFAASEQSYVEPARAIYDEWIRLMNQIGIDCMICGHDHFIADLPDGGHKGEPTPEYPTVISAARQDHPVPFSDAWLQGEYTGTAITCRDGKVTRLFTNHLGEVLDL